MPEVPRRKLGSTKLTVPALGIGAWQLSGPLMLDGKADGHPDVGEKEATKLIRWCGDQGINLIDTAEQYGAGEGERRVGKAIKGQRDKWLLSTKFGSQVGPAGERRRDISPEQIKKSLEGSLKRLQTDYIDIYLFHVQPTESELERAVPVLLEMKNAGRVRALGISSNQLATIEMAHRLGILDVVQFVQNLIEPQEELSDFLQAKGVGGMVRGVLAGGRLSGKYFEAPPEFSQDDVRRHWFEGERLSDYFKPLARFKNLLSMDQTMAAFALRYALDQPSASCVLWGGKSQRDYQDALAALALPPLSPALLDKIAALRGPSL